MTRQTGGAVVALVALGAALLALPARAGEKEASASAVVGRLNDALLSVLRDADTLGYQGRFERLAPAVAEVFDVPFMAEKSLGRWWRTLDEADRERWVELSHQFSTANYAASFDRDTGQTIELLGEEPAASDTVIVRTQITDPAGESIDMNYRMRRTERGWRIIDIYLKGTVSELALRRSDYTSVLERSGFEDLVAAMQTRIADLAAGRGTRQGS